LMSSIEYINCFSNVNKIHLNIDATYTHLELFVFLRKVVFKSNLLLLVGQNEFSFHPNGNTLGESTTWALSGEVDGQRATLI